MVKIFFKMLGNFVEEIVQIAEKVCQFWKTSRKCNNNYSKLYEEIISQILKIHAGNSA